MKRLSHIARWRRRGSVVSLLAFFCTLGAVDSRSLAADAQSGNIVTVHARTLVHFLHAYGKVEPMALVQVRAVDPGTLRGLHVVPGSVVVPGQVLAHIVGPRMQSLLTAREQALRSALAREETASRTLKILHRQLTAQLTTRQALDAAQSELTTARAAVQTADVQLREARDLQSVRAPVAGTVVAVQAADGEQATAEQTLLTLQPAGKLWIRAAYYGADAALLRGGMTGRFQPAGDGDAIPVKVATIASSVSPDGGRSVGLLPTSSPPPTFWVSGQWGTVTLQGPSQKMVAVPSSALILDRGGWWVLVHTAQGDKPQKVVPGPTQGWQTWIASGLQPGQQVVVQDAFLEYHRGIAQSYQPPD